MNLACVRDWPAVAKAAGYRAEGMATLCGVTPRTLQRFFKRRLKQSPREWIEDLRDELACIRLGEGWQVKAVSIEVCFESASAFCRAFRARHRTSPRRFQMGLAARWRLLLQKRRQKRKNA